MFRGETGAKFKWIATPAVDVANKGNFKNDPPNPPSKTGSDGDISMCIQERHAGGEFATAWKEADTGNLRRLYLSIADTFPHKAAAKTAAKIVKKVVAIDPDTLVSTHRDWWHNYYPSSFLSVPDAKLEGVLLGSNVQTCLRYSQGSYGDGSDGPMVQKHGLATNLVES